MAVTIQIHLSENEEWMKKALQSLGAISSKDKEFRNRSESFIAKALLEGPLEERMEMFKKKGKSKKIP